MSLSEVGFGDKLTANTVIIAVSILWFILQKIPDELKHQSNFRKNNLTWNWSYKYNFFLPDICFTHIKHSDWPESSDYPISILKISIALIYS